MTAPEVGPGAVTESVRLRDIAVRAGRRSVEHLLPAFRSEMLVRTKGDPHDLVTEHDIASEAIIREAILEQEPDSAIEGEEGGARGAGRVTWHVDPIDGTVNFARGLPFWCVSIAAAVDDVVVAGAIMDPVGGNEFTADLDAARLNGRPVRPTAAGREIEATVVSTFPRPTDLATNGQGALDACGRLLPACGTHRCLGSGALGLAYVAVGWADATFDLHTNPWDVAAGSLMVRRSGGRYVGLDGGVADEDPRTAYTRRGYYAVGAGASYPVLEEVVVGLSRDAVPVTV